MKTTKSDKKEVMLHSVTITANVVNVDHVTVLLVIQELVSKPRKNAEAPVKVTGVKLTRTTARKNPLLPMPKTKNPKNQLAHHHCPWKNTWPLSESPKPRKTFARQTMVLKLKANTSHKDTRTRSTRKN